MSDSRSIGRLLPVALVLVALAAFVFQGERLVHHWDEPVYLYAASHYSPGALVAGAFEPGNIPGFFGPKIGHVVVLQLLMKCLGQGAAVIPLYQAVYTVFILLSCVLIACSTFLLWQDKPRAFATGLVALLTPLSVYLAPKLLAEVPGSLATSLSVFCWAVCLRSEQRSKQLGWLTAGAVALVAGILSRGNVLLLAAGACVAAVAAPPAGLTRLQIIKRTGLLLAIAAVIFGVIQVLFGYDVVRSLSSASNVIDMKTPWQDSAKRTLYAFGPAAGLMLFVPFSKRRGEAVFWFVWFAVSVFPLLAGLRYIEERFLVSGIPALAGLIVLGGEVLWTWLSFLKRNVFGKGLAIAAALFVLIAGNAVFQPRTLWELDTREYGRAMDWLHDNHPDAPIIVPWAICDFHFARFAYPQAPVYLADVKALFTPGFMDIDPSRWYAERYLRDEAAVNRLGDGSIFYLTRKSLGKDPEDYSWIWGDPRYRFEPVFKSGRYRVYQLHRVAETKT